MIRGCPNKEDLSQPAIPSARATISFAPACSPCGKRLIRRVLRLPVHLYVQSVCPGDELIAPSVRHPCLAACDGAWLGDLDGAEMDEQYVAVLARAAGLEKAPAEPPEDVAAAAAQALNNSRAIKVPHDPAAELQAPMRAGVGL